MKTKTGDELGQAQLELELGFTLIKVCCIILIISNYHYISLSTISRVKNQTKLTQIILKYKIYLFENNTWLDMFKLDPYSTFPGGWVGGWVGGNNQN